MNDVIKEWLAKADGDYCTAVRELAVSDTPNFDAVCFHAQQCVEKLMKAVLIARRELPAKTHDLAVLANAIGGHFADERWSVEDLRFLSRAAVAFRYPGESAERDEAAEALAIAGRLREDLVAMIEAVSGNA